MAFPTSGEASTYSDYFKGKRTSNGDIYSHEEYTAALLPKSRWYDLPMGTHLRLTYMGRQVVVKVNDRGAGAGINRVLDLSRAAMAYLLGQSVSNITDANAGVIQLKNIEVVSLETKLGPVEAKK